MAVSRSFILILLVQEPFKFPKLYSLDWIFENIFSWCTFNFSAYGFHIKPKSGQVQSGQKFFLKTSEFNLGANKNLKDFQIRTVRKSTWLLI